MAQLLEQMNTNINKEFLQLYSNRNPVQILSSIKKIENSRNVQNDLMDLNKTLINQKSGYNKLKNDNRVREEKIKQLNQQFEEL